jgi:SAM-dependent methyltransferase
LGNSILNDFNVRAHLNAYWLRPEAALWDCIAARQLSLVLKGRSNIVEVGIGNGFFSFLLFGGRFAPEFDWFYSVEPQGFWIDADIFNHDSGFPLGDFVRKAPDVRLSLGLDHKQALLNQAARLGFVDELIQHDCNCPLPKKGTYQTAYSNMLYWLNDPIGTMNNIAKVLESGGKLITVFPNSDFYKSCVSYVRKDPLWKLLNRGRASHIMWHMDIPEFERAIRQGGVFELESATRYLAPSTLKTWDIGLRPISVPLLKMVRVLTPETRQEIKSEWCVTVNQSAFLSTAPRSCAKTNVADCWRRVASTIVASIPRRG